MLKLIQAGEYGFGFWKPSNKDFQSNADGGYVCKKGTDTQYAGGYCGACLDTRKQLGVS